MTHQNLFDGYILTNMPCVPSLKSLLILPNCKRDKVRTILGGGVKFASKNGLKKGNIFTNFAKFHENQEQMKYNLGSFSATN